MTEEIWIIPKTRESWDSTRWSPSTNSSPGGTTQVLWAGGGIGRLVLVDVRLDEGDAVDPDLAVMDRDGFAGQADHPLDERRRAAVLEAGRGREHDHVAPVVVAEAGRQLVDQDVVAGLERMSSIDICWTR